MTDTSVKYKLADLRAQAKSLGLKGWSVKNKEGLIEMLSSHAKSAVFETPAPAPVPAPVAEPVAEPEPAKKARTTVNSPWHTFLSQYCAEHGCTRKQAMSAKEDYEKFKASLVKS